MSCTPDLQQQDFQKSLFRRLRCLALLISNSEISKKVYLAATNLSNHRRTKKEPNDAPPHRPGSFAIPFSSIPFATLHFAALPVAPIHKSQPA